MKICCPKCQSVIDTESDPEYLGNEPEFAFCRNSECLWVINLKYDLPTKVDENTNSITSKEVFHLDSKKNIRPPSKKELIYSAQRFRQMIEVKDSRPFWQYLTVADGEVRPSHAALHGVIKPFDDPLWKVWFPPNSKKCRCAVVSLSEDEMKLEKLEVTNKIPFLPGQELPELGYRFDPWKLFL